MPKKPKKSPPDYPQGPLSPSKITSADGSTPTEDWLAKNARAKAIIMSTLNPDSEPWKIAEPLEYAADIWKALEDRYAPKNDPKGNRLERADFVNDWVEGKSMDRYRDGPKTGSMSTDSPADALNPDVANKFSKKELYAMIRQRDMQSLSTITAIDKHSEARKKALRQKEAQLAAAKVMVEHMPNRDQRLLWALLHGGKPETMSWFNGTNATTP